MMKRLLAALALAACQTLVAACGQKGPLFLPGDPSSIRTEIPPQPQEAPEPDDDPADDQ